MIDVSVGLLKERMQPTCEMVGNLVHIEQAYINTSHPDFFTSGPAFQAVAKVVEERRRRAIRLSSQSNMSASSDELPVTPITTVSAPHQHQQVPSSKDKDGGIFSYLFKSQGPPHPQSQQSPPPLPPSLPPPSSQSSAQQPISNSKERQSAPTPMTAILDQPLSEREEFETQLIMTLLHGYFAIVKRNLADTVPKATMHFLVNNVLEQLPSRLVAELYKEELFGELLKEDAGIVRQRTRCKHDLEALQQALTILNELRDISSD